MKKLIQFFIFLPILFSNINAQPYNISLIISAPVDCEGGGSNILFSDSGFEGDEFTIPEQTLPAEFASFQDYFNVFAGAKIGLESGALNENVSLDVDLEYFQCSPDQPRLLELIRMTIKVIGEKSGVHPAFGYYKFNDGKKAYIKLKAANLFEYVKKENITLEDLIAWFYKEGFEEDKLGITFKYSTDDPDWAYIYLEHFSKIAIGVNKSTTNVTSNNQVPTEFKLEQNYPNPFNPITQISFSLPKDGFTKLSVYNSIGMEIKTLVSESKNAGSYTITFNAADLPSGIYFYDLTSGNFKSTRKMILMK